MDVPSAPRDLAFKDERRRRACHFGKAESDCGKIKKRNSVAKVLCIGADNAVMQTRQMLLEKAGHSVTAATDLRQIVAACEHTQFSVAVLGQHVPAKEKLRVSEVVREHCPNAKILELHASLSPAMPNADAHISVNTDDFPEQLISAVSGLTTRRKRRGA
jgi:CheY-like chemotaxis protein